MRIALCGSMDFFELMRSLARDLRELGYEVFTPKDSEKSVEAKIANDYIGYYFNLIRNADAILVCNFEKKGISGYIGPNTFLEMGFAYGFKKKIFVLKSVDFALLPYADEIMAMQPICILGNLAILTFYDRELRNQFNQEFKNLSNADIAGHRQRIEFSLDDCHKTIEKSRKDETALYNQWRALQASCPHAKVIKDINASPTTMCTYCGKSPD